MNFDPLSLFTPREQSLDAETVEIIRQHDYSETLPIEENDQDDDPMPVHVLDLPMLRTNPPAPVLILILKLLSINQIWNFDNPQTKTDPETVFADKNIETESLDVCIDWLKIHCPRFDSAVKLCHLPNLSGSLKKANDYNDWLTRIISSDLDWVSESEREAIHKEASLRISENCGRTAQPELIRKIKLGNMQKISRHHLMLKEPSLTSDNLGLKTWGSSLILSQSILDNSDFITSPVLELGAGTGLVGMITSLLGFDTWVTDLKEIVPNLNQNFSINGISAHVHELDWRVPESFICQFPKVEFNTIILSDPLYSSEHPALINNVLKQFTKPKTQIIIQLPLRENYEDVRQSLWHLLDKAFVEQESDIKVGPDEFGDIQYIFKRYRLR